MINRKLKVYDFGEKSVINHCCKLMNYYLYYKCPIHKNPFDCPDNIITYDDVFDEYGIIIHDGGQSLIIISHCPWCGAKLPKSKHDKWCRIMEKLGIDPDIDDIPEKYTKWGWWLEE